MQAYDHFDSPLRRTPAKTRKTSWFWYFWTPRRPARLPRRPEASARAAAVPLAPAGGVGSCFAIRLCLFWFVLKYLHGMWELPTPVDKNKPKSKGAQRPQKPRDAEKFQRIGLAEEAALRPLEQKRARELGVLPPFEIFASLWNMHF